MYINALEETFGVANALQGLYRQLVYKLQVKIISSDVHEKVPWLVIVYDRQWWRHVWADIEEESMMMLLPSTQNKINKTKKRKSKEPTWHPSSMMTMSNSWSNSHMGKEPAVLRVQQMIWCFRISSWRVFRIETPRRRACVSNVSKQTSWVFGEACSFRPRRIKLIEHASPILLSNPVFCILMTISSTAALLGAQIRTLGSRGFSTGAAGGRNEAPIQMRFDFLISRGEATPAKQALTMPNMVEVFPTINASLVRLIGEKRE